MTFKGQQSTFISGSSRGPFSTALLHIPLFLFALQQKRTFGVWRGQSQVGNNLSLGRRCSCLPGPTQALYKQVLRLHESLLYVWQPWEGKMLCRRDTAGTSVIPILPSPRHFFRTLHRAGLQRCACCSRNTYDAALSNELSHHRPAILLLATCSSSTL